MEAIVDAEGNPVMDCKPSLGQDSQSQGRAPIYVPDGLVRHVLPFIDDSSIFLRGFHPFCAEAGEVELVAILYVLYSKDDSERE